MKVIAQIFKALLAGQLASVCIFGLVMAFAFLNKRLFLSMSRPIVLGKGGDL